MGGDGKMRLDGWIIMKMLKNLVEMSANDVLDVTAGGVKGNGHGNSGKRGNDSGITGRRGYIDEENIYYSRVENTFTKENGKSWEPMQQRRRNLL